ncbi:addiction module protein [Luteolibacter yonseiensis]|uniref:Addiction module protein n=1 Tax=Luteolibacter yonseiensis TaxID=1144680 RepID=A0A934VBI0_9BACT|nr:addiction module protein [Luteolibacter yonseiensis]MBK1817283.1 addiction module protein [Luteolibacter yonseiensis]
MSTRELAEEAISLPLAERVSLAQALWQSIDQQSTDLSDAEAIRVAMWRDAEMERGGVEGRTHEQVMDAARRAIGCA